MACRISQTCAILYPSLNLLWASSMTHISPSQSPHSRLSLSCTFASLGGPQSHIQEYSHISISTLGIGNIAHHLLSNPFLDLLYMACTCLEGLVTLYVQGAPKIDGRKPQHLDLGLNMCSLLDSLGHLIL